ncbi:hypothetical protein MmiEs2_15720 [Methanimicrococcus stummii]|uniref:GLUG domain-containing protein n=1 Tax=Methanimicrococcus stummii TaxID=3028294 RepID=A0AA96ZXS2_9EURY|nr:hypothetical protein [Methanimicrococcus sp. Es2]WNY29345.1 hypothetical protein MmiEs2_15720 [Methanimicrococcus sp. Es2]
MDKKNNTKLKIRKTALTVLVFASVFLIFSTMAVAGAATDVKTVSDFKNMANGGDYVLTNDLVIDTETWDSLVLTNLILDGNGQAIILTSESGSDFKGVFKELQDSTVSNLTVNVATDLQFSGTSGILAATVVDSNIDNCHVNIYETVTVTGIGFSAFGSLIGDYDSSSGEAVSSSSVSIFSQLEGIDNTGGLIGTLTNGTVTQSYVFGDVSATGNAVGGLIGTMVDGTVTESYATGGVSGSVGIGGLIGQMEDGTVENSYSAPYADSILTGSSVGGLVGFMSGGDIEYCYSAHLSQKLIGDAIGGSVSNSYFVNTVSDTYGTNKTDAQIRSIDTFSGWDVEKNIVSSKVWFIYDSYTYPQLSWQKQLTYDIYVDSVDHLKEIGRDWATIQDARGNTVRSFANARYIQTDDIEFTGTINTANVTYPYFNGMYDGNGYEIRDLTIEYLGTNVYTGLFPCVIDGVFQNIKIVNADVSSTAGHDGILIGRIYDEDSFVKSISTQIINCSVDGKLQGTSYVGGLVGNHTNGTLSIIHCISSVDVSGTDNYVGGLVGFSSGPSTLVYNSSSSGSVKSSQNNVGGLLGGGGLAYSSSPRHSLTILDSSSSCLIEAMENAGGLIGYIWFESNAGIYNSNYVGSVATTTPMGTRSASFFGMQMDSGAGGLVGNIRSDTLIQNSYAAGTVESADFGAGGLVGCKIEGVLTIADSCFDGDVTAATDGAGGLVGSTNGVDISGSSASGIVTVGGDYAGGLLGNTYLSAKIEKSSFAGNVIADGSNVGGLVGAIQRNGTVSESTASANVQAKSNVGGLIGFLNSGTLSDCYVNGRVVADSESGISAAGGAIGYLSAAESNSDLDRIYSTSEVTGAGSAVGGLLGLVGDGVSVNTVALNDSFAFNDYVKGASLAETGRVFGTVDSGVNFVLDSIQVLDSMQGNFDISKETADVFEVGTNDLWNTFDDSGNLGTVWEPLSTNSWKADLTSEYGFPILTWQAGSLGMWQPWPQNAAASGGGSGFGQAYVVNPETPSGEAGNAGSDNGSNVSDGSGQNTPAPGYSDDLPNGSASFPYWILIVGFIVVAGAVIFVVGRRYMK